MGLEWLLFVRDYITIGCIVFLISILLISYVNRRKGREDYRKMQESGMTADEISNHIRRSFAELNAETPGFWYWALWSIKCVIGWPYFIIQASRRIRITIYGK